MIGWLSGVIRAKRPPHLLLEVQGVGYEVEAPMTTFYSLPSAGEPASLYTHQVVREDAHSLYGFAREQDRNLFRLLIRVSGVGPKLALAVLSTLESSTFARCVREGDSAALTRVPGVGKKTADRLIIEMRDRLEDGPFAGTPAGLAASAPEAEGATPDPQAEAVSALVALGFRPQEAAQRVRAVAREGMAREDIIRKALQSAAGRG